MQNLYRGVDKWHNAELRKDFNGHALICISGEIKVSGLEYHVNQKWLRLKNGQKVDFDTTALKKEG